MEGLIDRLFSLFLSNLRDILLDDVLMGGINANLICHLDKFLIILTNDYLHASLASAQEYLIVVLVLEGYLIAFFIDIAQLEFPWKALEDSRQEWQQLVELLLVVRFDDVNFVAENNLEDHWLL